MTTYPNLLAELAKYEGGKFVPVCPLATSAGLQQMPLQYKDNRYWWRFGPITEQALDHDAHAHIRCAAEDVVRDWCDQKPSTMGISTAHGVTLVENIEGGPGRMCSFTVIGSGPTIEDALLAAAKTINGGTQ